MQIKCSQLELSKFRTNYVYHECQLFMRLALISKIAKIGNYKTHVHMKL